MPLDDNDIKQLISILQRGLSSQEPQNNDEIEQPVVRTKNIQPKRQNKFDSMQEKNLHKEDSQIDKLLNINPPSLRSREFAPVTVVCRVCGKKEDINPSLLYESPNRYKCNQCARSPG